MPWIAQRNCCQHGDAAGAVATKLLLKLCQRCPMGVVYDSIRITDKPFSCREHFDQHRYVFTAVRRVPTPSASSNPPIARSFSVRNAMLAPIPNSPVRYMEWMRSVFAPYA